MTASNDPFPNSSSSVEPSEGGPVVRTFIVDDDPIFRVGVRAWLQQYPEFDVGEDIGERAIALPRLRSYLESIASLPTLIVFGGPLRTNEEQSTRVYAQLMDWCRELKMIDSAVMIVIVGDERYERIAAAQQAGTNGYAYKGWSSDHLLRCLRQITSGQWAWPDRLVGSSAARQRDLPWIQETTEASSSGSFSPQQHYPRQISGGALAQGSGKMTRRWGATVNC